MRMTGSSPHCSAEFLVGHRHVVLLLAPKFRHLLRLHEPENAVRLVLPPHERRVVVGVGEQIPHELPQVVALRHCRWNETHNP